MANEKNLRPLEKGTERARDIAAMGGKAKGENSKKRRAIRDTVDAFLLSAGNKAGASNVDLIFGQALMRKGRAGDIRAMELIAKICGELTTSAAAGDAEGAEAATLTPPAKIDKIHSWLSWQSQSGNNYAFLYGTTRSGKTYAVCQWICEEIASGRLRGIGTSIC